MNGNPINYIDPRGLDLIDDIIDGIEGHGPLTDEVDITGILDDEFAAVMSVIGEAYNDCVHCAVKCTLGVALPSEATSAAVRRLLRSKAKSLAKASLKKAVPYYNVVDTIVTAGLMAECAIDCQSKQ